MRDDLAMASFLTMWRVRKRGQLDLALGVVSAPDRGMYGCVRRDPDMDPSSSLMPVECPSAGAAGET